MIYQDFAVFPNLTVAENIALNGEVKNKAKLVNWKEIHRVAAEAMAQVGAEIDPDVKLEQLSVANKQMVAICRAIINDAKFLILEDVYKRQLYRSNPRISLCTFIMRSIF